MIRDKLLISDIRIHTRVCSCVRLHKYWNVRFWILDSGFWILDSGFWILDSEYILALALIRKILYALMLYCQSLNTLALNSHSQDALVLNINCSNLNSTYRVSHNAKNPGIRDTNIWTEGVEFHTQDLGSNLSQLQSSPSTYESV